MYECFDYKQRPQTDDYKKGHDTIKWDKDVGYIMDFMTAIKINGKVTHPMCIEGQYVALVDGIAYWFCNDKIVNIVEASDICGSHWLSCDK